ncbi:MAG: hypothetical protein WCD67_23370 [Xanthobacteraceae bacterium]
MFCEQAFEEQIDLIQDSATNTSRSEVNTFSQFSGEMPVLPEILGTKPARLVPVNFATKTSPAFSSKAFMTFSQVPASMPVFSETALMTSVLFMSIPPALTDRISLPA